LNELRDRFIEIVPGGRRKLPLFVELSPPGLNRGLEVGGLIELRRNFDSFRLYRPGQLLRIAVSPEAVSESPRQLFSAAKLHKLVLTEWLIPWRRTTPRAERLDVRERGDRLRAERACRFLGRGLIDHRVETLFKVGGPVDRAPDSFIEEIGEFLSQ